MKKLLLILALCFTSSAAWAQNTTCSDRPANDTSNACANTRFVQSHVSAIPYTNITNVPPNTFLGNNTGSTANAIAFNGASATSMLSVFSTSLKGLVPAPGSINGNCLKDDATWASCGGNILVDSYATLRAGSPPSALTSVYVEGRTTANTQGGGWFTLDPTDSTSADNDGTILVDAANNRWKRQYDDGVHVDWFDFTTANSGAANTTAINNAIGALPLVSGSITGKLVFPVGTYSYAGFSVDKAIGLRITSAGGAIANPILKCTLTTGSCITARSSFDVTMEYLDLRFTTAGAAAYLVDLRHAPSSSTDSQGFYFYRSTMNGVDTLSGGNYTGFGFALDQSSSTIIEGSKFVSLIHAVDGQNSNGGSYANEVRISHTAFADITGFPLNYLGDHWVVSDSYFQPSHDGTGRVAFSGNTTSTCDALGAGTGHPCWNALTMRDVSVYDTTTSGTSFLTLGTGKKLTVIGGYWGGIASSNMFIANGPINGVSINTLATNFSNVAFANVSGQTDWIFAGSNVTGSTTLVGNPTNVSALNTDGVTPNFSQGVGAANGWRVNPDGTVEVWGTVSGITTGSSQAVTFNHAFSTACYATIAVLSSPAAVTNVLSNVGACTTTAQNVYVNGTGTNSVTYRAIGR